MQNYSVSYSDSNEKTNYYISGNYFDQQGIVLNTGYKRYTFQLNTDSKITSRLKIGNSLTLNNDINQAETIAYAMPCWLCQLNRVPCQWKLFWTDCPTNL